MQLLARKLGLLTRLRQPGLAALHSRSAVVVIVAAALADMDPDVVSHAVEHAAAAWADKELTVSDPVAAARSAAVGCRTTELVEAVGKAVAPVVVALVDKNDSWEGTRNLLGSH